jgi:predicted amidohydrolase YtcJ
MSAQADMSTRAGMSAQAGTQAGGEPASRPARMLIAGGPIRPVAGPGLPQAVAVTGDTLIEVGSLADCRDALGRGYQEVDLAGATLVPGFVDAHCHPLMLGQTGTWVDVSPARAPDIPALVKLLRQQAAVLPPGEPLRAYGYNHRALPERRHPTAADLDQAATDREIYVMNQSGHGGVLNTAGLTRCRITASTPDIAGGHIGRDASGRPDGLVMDAACDLLTGDNGVKLGRHGPNLHLPPAPGEAARWLDDAQRAFLAAGVTSLVDAQVSQRELTAYTQALAMSRLQVRVGIRVISSYLPELLGLGLTGPFGGDLLDVTGVKIYADGTLGGWTAWFPCGYHGEAETTGLLYHTPQELADIIARAHLAGLPTGTHAQSPGAIGLVVDAIEQVQARLGRQVRHTVEHCGLPTPELVRRMTRAEIQPVMQPAHHASFGDGVLAAVGEQLGQRYNPAGDYAALGMLPALSSDAPVTPPDPLGAIRAAIVRTTGAGTLLGGSQLRLDPAGALAAHTIAAARAAGKAHRVGSLEPGKLADLTVLDADPVTAAPEHLGDIRVTQTWVGGTLRYQRP